MKAFYYLRRAFEIDPKDPQTVYDLAFAYLDLGEEWGMAERLGREEGI